jgi:hypothetical protein
LGENLGAWGGLNTRHIRWDPCDGSHSHGSNPMCLVLCKNIFLLENPDIDICCCCEIDWTGDEDNIRLLISSSRPFFLFFSFFLSFFFGGGGILGYL